MTLVTKKTNPALYLSLPSYQGNATKEEHKRYMGPGPYGATQKEKTRLKPSQKQRKPIRKRSKSMTKKMEQYRKQKEAYLKNHHWCDVLGKPFKAIDIHHSRGRAGSLLLDERFWFAVSRSAHELIHKRPEWARQAGYLCDKGHWNSIDMPSTKDLP